MNQLLNQSSFGQKSFHFRVLGSLLSVALLGACASVPDDAPKAMHEAKAELDTAKKVDTKAIFPKTVTQSKEQLDAAVSSFEAVPKDERSKMDWANSDSVKSATKVRDRMKKANNIRTEMDNLDGEMDSIEGDASIASLSSQVAMLKSKISDLQKEKELAARGGSSDRFALLSEMPLHGPTVFFDTDKTSISERDLPALNELAKTLSGNKDLKLQLVGYADPRGAMAYNTSLSEKRAKAVHDYLVKSGLSSDQLSIQAMGSKAAFFKTALPKLQLERRVEMLISAK